MNDYGKLLPLSWLKGGRFTDLLLNNEGNRQFPLRGSST